MTAFSTWVPVTLALKELRLLKEEKLVLLIQATFCFCEVVEDIVVHLHLYFLSIN